MTSNGKIIFLNVLNIKPNMPIQYNSLACFSSLNTPEYGKGIEMREIPCDNLIVFGVNEESLANTILSNGPVLSSLLLNALDEGFGKRISACAIFTIDSESEQSRLQNIDCHSLFIAYK